MKRKHSPTPWTIDYEVSDQGPVLAGANSTVNVQCYNKPDAERIMACVNACDGINPKAVRDLIDALKEITHELEFQYDNCNSEGGLMERKRIRIVNRAKRALSKAEK